MKQDIEAYREEAEKLGLLNGDEDHDLKVLNRLWFHYNLQGA